jgi:hypothetical protein
MKYSYRKKHCKGQITDMQAAVLAVAAILIFSIFLYNAYTALKDRMATNSCKSSIEAHSIVATGTASEMFTDIKCPTQEITIKKLKTAKATIAEDMHRCWYIWGEGKGQYFKGDGTFCHICSVYQFGDKGQEVRGFMNYLETEPLKVKYPGESNTGISYQDYFNGYSTPNSAKMVNNNQIQSLAELDVIDTSQKYATIFIYASGKDNIEKVLEGNRMAVGTAGGIMILAGTAAVGGSVAGISASLGAALEIALAAGTATAWNPVGWVILGVTGVVAAVVGGVMMYNALFNNDNPEWVSFIAFRPYDEKSLDSLGCQKLEVNQMSNAGK